MLFNNRHCWCLFVAANIWPFLVAYCSVSLMIVFDSPPDYWPDFIAMPLFLLSLGGIIVLPPLVGKLFLYRFDPLVRWPLAILVSFILGVIEIVCAVNLVFALPGIVH